MSARIDAAPFGRLPEPAADDAGARQIADAIQHVALNITSVRGENVLRELASFLCHSLQMDFALIGRQRSDGLIEALVAIDRQVEMVDFYYQLAGTPCETVWGGSLRIIADGLATRYPVNPQINREGFRSYAGLPLFDSAGAPIGIIAVLHREQLPDPGLVEALIRICSVRAAAELERLRAEESIRESEEQYRAIFNVATDALILWDSQLRRVDVNPAYERIYGWSREEVLGRGYEHLSGITGYAQPRLEMVRRALAGEACRGELEAVRRNGERFMTEVHAIPFRHRGEPHVLAIARDITESRRTEEALRASEEQYRAIFNATADAMLLWDSTPRPVDVNTAYERNFGWSREEMLGGTVDAAYDEEYLRPRIEMVRRALAGEHCHAELEAIRKNGERFPIELQTIPYVHRGAPHVLAIVRDITERRRAEAALRASEEQYRAIFGASADGLLLVDREARVIDINPALAQMFGYSLEEFAGGTIGSLAADPGSAGMRSMLQAIGRGEAFETEGTARRRDGSHFAVNARATPMLYRGQTHLLVTLRDITRRIEEQRQLVRSEQRLRATVESSLDCIIAVDLEGCIIGFNPMAERTFRIPAQQAIGRDMAELLLPERFRAKHGAGVANYLRTGNADFVGRRLDVVGLRADGEEFDAELTIALSESGEGRIFIAFLRDVTEQKAAAAQREQLQAQLRQAQKMDAIGHLAGGIAHDFNNLLTSLTGYVAMAQERLAATGEQRASRHLEKSLRSAERARSLVQQLLVFSRGQKGDRVSIDLATHLGEFEELLRSTLPSSVQFSSEYQAGLPPVMVDPTQLDQVLMNLCINARDAMHSSGSLQVSLHGRQLSASVCSACRKDISGDFIELAVTDSGLGITPMVLERIFDPFFTTKQAGKGTGMGLSTTHGIVHDYGGHILVDTEVGRGTSFRVLLPRVDATARSRPEPSAGTARPLRNGVLRGTILLVDDDAHVLEYMRDQLGEWGLTVHAFADPRTALSAMSQGELTFDVAVLDQTMPGMSGLRLARALTELLPDPRIILYTGYSESIDDDECRDCYVIEVLHKPVDHAVLYRLLRDNLPA